MSAKRFPIDYDALKKGDTISAVILERLIGVPRDSDKYQLRLMGVQQQVADEMEARGKPVTVIVRSKELVILTDAEASIYNAERLAAHLNGVMRSHQRSCAVDTANLDDLQKKEHLRRVEVGGKFCQAIVDTGRRLKLPEYTRQTPALGSGA